MSGVEILGGGSYADDWHDSAVSGEHFRGTVATGTMSDEVKTEQRSFLSSSFLVPRSPFPIVARR